MLTFVIGTKRLCPVVATLTVGKMVKMEQKKVSIENLFVDDGAPPHSHLTA